MTKHSKSLPKAKPATTVTTQRDEFDRVSARPRPLPSPEARHSPSAPPSQTAGTTPMGMDFVKSVNAGAQPSKE